MPETKIYNVDNYDIFLLYKTPPVLKKYSKFEKMREYNCSSIMAATRIMN